MPNENKRRAFKARNAEARDEQAERDAAAYWQRRAEAEALGAGYDPDPCDICGVFPCAHFTS